MGTLIVYATKYGCTEKCTAILSERLTGKVDRYNLRERRDFDLAKYDKVIIGGSIYMGKIQKEVSEFCIQNLNLLKNKKVGLFICCMRDKDMAEMELHDSFPQELLSNAIAKECFGGEFLFQKMNFFDKFIVKKVAKVDKEVSDLWEENINRFVQTMNHAS